MLLKVCVNGARPLSAHPRLSSDPQRVAQEAAEATVAGAGAVHVHAKGADGRDSLTGEDVARFVSAVRQACPGTPVGTTTGAWAMPDPGARVAAIASWRVRPDFASVNWHEGGADAVAAGLLRQGVAVEAGIWNEDGLQRWGASSFRGRSLRVLVELPDESDAEQRAEELIAGVRRIELDVPILVHGEGASTWNLIGVAARHGLHTRVGLEDTLHLPDGSTASSNADLVRAALEIVSVADAASARRPGG